MRRGIGEARPGGEVAGFDGGHPGGFDWESSGVVEVADDGSNDGEVVGVEGSWGCRGRGMDGGDGVVLRLEREAPQLVVGGSLHPLSRMFLLYLEKTVTMLLSNKTLQP